MTRRASWRTVWLIALVLALGGLPAAGLATRALQTMDIFSPSSGHAQVIAQGIAPLPAETVWRTVFHSVAPGAPTELTADGPGFVLVDTGGIRADDGERPKLLAPAEATFHEASPMRLTPVGDRPVGVFAIDAVSPESADDAGDGIPVYTSAPFQAPSGNRDIDLVRDLLEPDESTTVIGNEAPVLILVTLGALRAEATDGSSASLRVGEAATFQGDIVLTAEGQAPSTFVAAVIGREVASASGTPGATPQAAVAGSVQLAVYACPPLVTPADASPGRCLRDPEAVALELVALGDGAADVGPSSERNGLPTWTGLAGGDYGLRATGFKQGFGRFFVRGLEGVGGDGAQGFPASEQTGYLIPISADAADYSLEVYVFAPSEGGTPVAETTPAPSPEQTPVSVIVVEGEPSTGESATPVATATPVPAGPTEIPSVIQIETPVPGSSPTPTRAPRPTSTPTPRASPRATEPALVESTAVARPRRGTVTVRVWGCSESIDTFDPNSCAQAVDGFNLQLVNEDGDVVDMGEADIESNGSVSWTRLPLGAYLFQQPTMLAGAVTYYAPDLELNEDGTGYLVTIDAEEPVATFDVYNLPPPPAAQPTVAPVAAADSDGDGLVDSDETNLYGTDPTIADSDFDGVFDGAEVANETDPLTAEGAASGGGGGDSDGDRLADADEPGYGTDIGNPDTDGDGYYDGDEVNLGTDPLDANSFPSG